MINLKSLDKRAFSDRLLGGCPKILLLIVSLVFFIAGPVSAASVADDTPPVLEKVSLQLSWKHQFQFAGFYAAVEQGYFAEQGLEVEILEIQKGVEPLAEVLRGRADFGIYTDDLIFERMEGKPVVLLANYFKRFPMVILAQPGLQTLADLKGKRLMIAPKRVTSMTVRAAFQKAGLIPGENLELVSHSFDIGSLVRGEVDAVGAFRSNEPFLLDQQNIPYEMIELGKTIPGLGGVNLFTSEAQAAQHPYRTRSFVEASNRGWQYALDHPEEIVDLILKHYKPQASREALQFEAEKTRELMLPETYPVGAIIDERIHSVVQGLMAVEEQKHVVLLQGLLFESKLSGWQLEEFTRLKNRLNLTPQERAWVRDHPVVHAAVGNFPPYMIWDNDPSGISIDLLNRIAEWAGFEVIYQHCRSCPEAFENIRKHTKLDLLPVAKNTPERQSFMAFSKDYLKLTLVIFARQDESGIFGINDLSGKTIAIEKGYELQERLAREFPTIRQLLVDNASEALAAVSENRVDAYVGNLTVAQFHIIHQGFTNLKVAAPVDLGYHSLAFAMRDDWPQLASIIDKGLATITPEERSDINRQYFIVEIDQSVDYRRLWWLLLAIVLGVFFVLLWNRMLRRKVTESSVELNQELKLRHQSEARYRRVIDSLENDYVFYTIDPNGFLSYVSPGVTKILGYSPDECMVHYSRFIADVPGNQQTVVRMEKSLRGAKQAPFTGEMRHKNGSSLTFEAIINPVFDDQGKVIALESMLRDITGRKQAMQVRRQQREELEVLVQARTVELQQSQEHALSMLDAIGKMEEGLLIVDSDYRIRYMNSVMVDWFGEQTGNSCYSTLAGRDQPCPCCRFGDVIQKGETVKYQSMDVNGRTLSFVATQIHNQDGSTSKIVMLRDISSRKA